MGNVYHAGSDDHKEMMEISVFREPGVLSGDL